MDRKFVNAQPATGNPSAGLGIGSTEDERAELLRWIVGPSTPPAVRLRCEIVLAGAEGKPNAAIARDFGVSPQMVGKWRARFRAGGVPALQDRPRSGAPRTIATDTVQAVVDATLTEPPANGVRWTKRDLAARVGISPSSVVRIWQRFGITPGSHREVDGQYLAAATWCALFIAPPETVMVVAVDGARGAGIVAPTGDAAPPQGIARRRRLAELLSERGGAGDRGELARFLRTVQQRVSHRHEIHLICHGHRAHDLEAIVRAQERNHALHLHFAPSKDFWLTLVERYLGLLAPAAGTEAAPVPAVDRILHSAARTRRPFTWYQP
ncbi:helix-turn-helix domain-containing protein [Nocardia sp. NPDC050378]|uniref:helix-turn-helix domain-containing protein n=1 Tax=Nocardia sp. NPDC050378 TaxID=3155400 RepID=UPI0033E6C108